MQTVETNILRRLLKTTITYVCGIEAIDGQRVEEIEQMLKWPVYRRMPSTSEKLDNDSEIVYNGN
jgi:hypothetical protein